MSNKKFQCLVLRAGRDGDGEEIDFKGVRVKTSGVPVTLEFDPTRVVGAARITVGMDACVAELEFFADVPRGIPLYPAIGGKIVRRDLQDNRLVRECLIESIGLCEGPNADSRIEPIVLPPRP